MSAGEVRPAAAVLPKEIRAASVAAKSPPHRSAKEMLSAFFSASAATQRRRADAVGRRCAGFTGAESIWKFTIGADNVRFGLHFFYSP